MADLLERDSYFLSGEEEEDLDTDLHSPTDASEDSVEVKITPISPRGACNKNKRKCVAPRKVSESFKVRVLDLREKTLWTESNCHANNPFRPWSVPPPPSDCQLLGRLRGQNEPLSLVANNKQPCTNSEESVSCVPCAKSEPRPQEVVRLSPVDRTALSLADFETVDNSQQTLDCSSSSDRVLGEACEVSKSPDGSSSAGEFGAESAQGSSPHRNYKNMTRERRVEANARERTRVHTISAAFDTLRRAIPAYSHNQKLSKLSILRVACSYILTLSRVAGDDYSADQSAPSLDHCVDNVGKTIQMEGKIRKKKDD